MWRSRAAPPAASPNAPILFESGYSQISADGRFTVKEGECFGACGDAPVMLVDNKRMASFMSNEKIDRLVEELK